MYNDGQLRSFEQPQTEYIAYWFAKQVDFEYDRKIAYRLQTGLKVSKCKNRISKKLHKKKFEYRQ